VNYLAHTFLAPSSTEEKLGALYADFVRGTLSGLSQQYSALIIRGITQHRKIDQFTDQHSNFLQSRALFSPERRRYSGIMLDVLYDHFLHRYWSDFTDQSKPAFIQEIYELLEKNETSLPSRLATITPHMVANDWLNSYEDIEVIGLVLDRISMRIKRDNALSGGIEEIKRHYEPLEEHFLTFFPQAIEYANHLNKTL